MKSIEFCIYQRMFSGSGEAAQHKYHLAIGKSGKRWVYANEDNAAENIYVDGGKGSEGFGGRTLTFVLVDETTVDFIGPWKTGASELLKDTGIDLRDRYLTRGIVALRSRSLGYPKGDIFTDILHYDESPVLGTFNRVADIAQREADKLGVTVRFSVVSKGGGTASWKDPIKSKEEMSV